MEVTNKLIINFEKDWKKFTFISDTSKLKLKAKELLTKYGVNGLRTLDSIQFASAIEVKNQAELFITSDKLLLELFKKENLNIME